MKELQVSESTLILFTSLVMQTVEHPVVCFKFLERVNYHYLQCRKTFCLSEGLLTISSKMQAYIQDNKSDFIISQSLRPF